MKKDGKKDQDKTAVKKEKIVIKKDVDTSKVPKQEVKPKAEPSSSKAELNGNKPEVKDIKELKEEIIIEDDCETISSDSDEAKPLPIELDCNKKVAKLIIKKHDIVTEHKPKAKRGRPRKNGST